MLELKPISNGLDKCKEREMVDYRVEHISEDERKACFGVSE